jgi:hypothetical protein
VIRPDPEPAVLPPVFLERQSYRRRRLTDAARLLPLLGAALFSVPLLWPTADDAGAGITALPTSAAITYLFSIWAALILGNVLFGLFTRGWMRADAPPESRADERAEDGSG